LSTATEEVAVVTGPSIGAVKCSLGNATELIIALVALPDWLTLLKQVLLEPLSVISLVMGFPCFWAVCATKNRSFSLWRG